MNTILIVLKLFSALYLANASPSVDEQNNYGSLTGRRLQSYIIYNLPANMDPVILLNLETINPLARISILYIYERCITYAVPRLVLKKLENEIVSGIKLKLENNDQDSMMNSIKNVEKRIELMESTIENKFFAVIDVKKTNYKVFVRGSKINLNTDIYKLGEFGYSMLLEVILKFYPDFGFRLLTIDNLLSHFPKSFTPQQRKIKRTVQHAVKKYLENSDINVFRLSLEPIYNNLKQWFENRAPNYDYDSEKRLIEILKLPLFVFPMIIGLLVNVENKAIIEELVEYFDKWRFYGLNLDETKIFQMDLRKALLEGNTKNVEYIIATAKLELRKRFQNKKLHKFNENYSSPPENIVSRYNGLKQISASAAENASTLSELRQEILTLPPNICNRLIILDSYNKLLDDKQLFIDPINKALIAIKKYANEQNEEIAIKSLKESVNLVFKEGMLKFCKLFALWETWMWFIQNKSFFAPIYENASNETFLKERAQPPYSKTTLPLFLEAIKLPIAVHPIVLGSFFMLPSFARNIILVIYTNHRIYKSTDEKFAYMQVSIVETILKWRENHNKMQLMIELEKISQELYFDDTYDNLQIPDYRSIKQIIYSVYHPSQKAESKIPSNEHLSGIKNLDQLTLVVRHLPQDCILRIAFIRISLSKWSYDNPIRISVERAIVNAVAYFFQYGNELFLSLKLADVFDRITLVNQRELQQERYHLAESISNFSYPLGWTSAIHNLANTLPVNINDLILYQISGKQNISYKVLAEDFTFKWMEDNQHYMPNKPYIMGGEKRICSVLPLQKQDTCTNLFLPEFTYPDILSFARFSEIPIQIVVKKLYNLLRIGNKHGNFKDTIQRSLIKDLLTYFDGGNADALLGNINVLITACSLPL